jgi:hypothetical protein
MNSHFLQLFFVFKIHSNTNLYILMCRSIHYRAQRLYWHIKEGKLEAIFNFNFRQINFLGSSI